MKRRTFLSTVGAVSLCSLPAFSQQTYRNSHLLISASELRELTRSQSNTNLTVIDVRTKVDYETSHIPGALNLEPNAVDESDAPVLGDLRPTTELEELFRSLGISKNTKLVFYDDKGGFHAARMFWLAEYLGLRDVAVMNGGIQAWHASGFSSASGMAAKVSPGHLSASLTPRLRATADYILSHSNDEGTLVIDVRSAKSYATGHIPWALNLPWKANLEKGLMFKSAADLRQHFEATGVRPDKNLVIHCETGLASAHSYLALRVLGYPRVRVYDRSWAEWGKADALPRTVGS